MSPCAIRFVLVRPANALNIGAAARAMANFGLDDLVAVDPYARRWRDAHSSRYGSALLSRARLLTLEEAVADRDLVLGTCSAHDRAVRTRSLTLPALGRARGKRVAVLFGSERDGLSNAELGYCHALLRIPTAPEAPSMNLGQAAALVAYECARRGLERVFAEPLGEPPDGRQLEGLVDAALRASEKARVNAHLCEPERRRKIRRGFLRWTMTRKDASWLRGLLEKLSRAP